MLVAATMARFAMHMLPAVSGGLLLPQTHSRVCCLASRVSQHIQSFSTSRCTSSGSPTTSTRQEPIADVAIAGGGMVGAALAALLCANPMTRSLRILLVDQKAQPFHWHAPTYPELRVSTITPASITCLSRAGAWEHIQPHCSAFTTMQVWDTAGPAHIRWHASDAGRETMGVVAENSLLQASLLQAMKQSLEAAGQPLTCIAAPSSSEEMQLEQLQPGVTCLWPASLQHLQLPPSSQAAVSDAGTAMAAAAPGNSLAQLLFKGGASVRARLVVAADGAGSRVRSMAGFRTFGWSYNQRGLVATVELEGGGTDTAWQRFLPTGPMALLPVRDGLANIVWSTTSDMAAELEKMSPEQFADVANKALHGQFSEPSMTSSWTGPLAPLLSGVAAAATAASQATAASDAFQAPPRIRAWVGSSPRSFPLQLKQSGRYASSRIALVGDAAHAVHPLAGQGVNLGFGDAVALADALQHAVEVGADPGDVMLLQDHYERPRQQAVWALTAALDGLHRVFQVQAQPFSGARNLGLGLLNMLPPVKNNIMKYAMGL